MTCGGCSGAVTRALKKAQDNGAGSEYNTLLRLTIAHIEPVSSYDVILEKQEVIVKGSAPYDDVLGFISKTGKEVGIKGYPREFLLILSLLGSLWGGCPRGGFPEGCPRSCQLAKDRRPEQLPLY